MTTSLISAAAAPAIGLSIFALGERIRGRGERRPNHFHPITRKDTP